MNKEAKYKRAIKTVCSLMVLTFIINQSACSQERNANEKNKEEAALTNEQKVRVKKILSKYDADNLSSDDAIEINEAFRNAGIKNGSGLHRAISDAGFDPEEMGRLAPKPNRKGKSKDEQQNEIPNKRKNKADGNNYSIEQAISDHAQLHTIAFDALAFMTGDMCSDSFLPPGKVSDFFGFQYLRDTDLGEMGHNTSFVPRSANNVLYILNENQVNQLIELARKQEKRIGEFAYKRFPLIKVFRQFQNSELPDGKTMLNPEAVKKYSAELYQIDGLLSYQRAEVLGNIIRSLSEKQKVYLDNMKAGNSQSWPEKNDQLDKKRYSHEVHVAVMTYASELFSWYAGSVDADTYFCPERHGMYFGSFYLKDIPAMGNKDYTISTELTGNKGEDFLKVLNEQQKKQITSLVDIQRNSMNEIVDVRRRISKELRKFMNQEKIDKERVLSLSSKYGELDGEISYYYAVNFTNVFKSLSKTQLKELYKLRNLDEYPCRGAYLYSNSIKMPEIEDTEKFFE